MCACANVCVYAVSAYFRNALLLKYPEVILHATVYDSLSFTRVVFRGCRLKCKLVPRDVYVTYGVHDSRLVDRSNFFLLSSSLVRFGKHSPRSAPSGKSEMCAVEGNIGRTNNERRRCPLGGYKSTRCHEERAKRADKKKGWVGFLDIRQKKFQAGVSKRAGKARFSRAAISR